MGNGVVLFVDPSYTCTGLAFVSMGTKSIHLDRLKHNKKFKWLDADANDKGSAIKRFDRYYKVAVVYCYKLLDLLARYNPERVVMEYPLPMSQAGGALVGLGMMLLGVLRDYRSIEHIELINPSWVNRTYKKISFVRDRGSQAVRVAEVDHIMSTDVRVADYSLGFDVKKMDADMATAFLFWYYKDICDLYKGKSYRFDGFGFDDEVILV
jgi:hypothetical protein